MKKRWFILVAVAAAVLSLPLLYCERQEALEWDSAIDIPINLELKVWRAKNIAELGLPPNIDTSSYVVLFDMSSSSFTIYDEIFLIRKMKNPKAEYKIRIINNYESLDFVFYALVAHKQKGEENGIESMAGQNVYRVIRTGGDGEYVRVLGRDGFSVPAGKDLTYSDSTLNNALCSLVLNSPSISWRWLAEVRLRDYKKFIEEMNKPGADTSGVVDTRFKLSVRGTSNLDSVLTF